MHRDLHLLLPVGGVLLLLIGGCGDTSTSPDPDLKISPDQPISFRDQGIGRNDMTLDRPGPDTQVDMWVYDGAPPDTFRDTRPVLDFSIRDGNVDATFDGPGLDATSPDTRADTASPPTCADNAINGGETDLNCGGPCPPCVGGQACITATDCDGRACINGTCGYAPSCAELYQLYGQRDDGVYLIDPTGGDDADKFQARCDMTTDGGGWTLVGKGRQGWLWLDDGQGQSADVLAHNVTSVAYLPSETVRAIAGGKSWDNWAHGLRVVRHSGVDDRWFIAPKTATDLPFAWSLLNDSSGGCGVIPISTVRAHFRRVGGTGQAIHREGRLLDSHIGGDANDCGRVFTTGWDQHNCVMGFSAGASCAPTDCWMASTEGHCIPHSTVWVKNCPTCPHINYQAGDTASYPGSGDTWRDISGDGTQVDATIDSSCLQKTVLGGVDTFSFPGDQCSRAQFDNSSLSTQAMTIVAWVYSRHPVASTDQGGLYSNRSDVVQNDEAWVWFGKWSIDEWYFRVMDGDLATPCCDDLAGSGSSTFSANVPLNTWRMVHFGYQTGKINGWKWGHNGSTAYLGTLAKRPYRQAEAISTIGYGHPTAGSYWFGGIDSVKIYRRLLSDAEILAEFNATRTRYGL